MARHLTTNQLLQSAVTRAMIPITQNTFTNEDLLRFANEEMDNGIVPHILSFHENYLLHTSDVSVEQDIFNYEIPHRAVGNKLKDLFYKDDTGNRNEMTQIDIGDVPFYEDTSTGPLNLFYVTGNEINIVENNIASSGSFEFVYYLRPSELVDEARSARIIAIDTNTNQLTLDRIPEGYVFAESILDITAARSPYKPILIDIAGDIVTSGDDVIFAMPLSASLRGIKVGDIVTLAEETIVPQIPLELQSMLAQRIAMRCLDAIGDIQGLQSAAAKLAEMEIKTGAVLDNRVENAPQKVFPKHSFIRFARR